MQHEQRRLDGHGLSLNVHRFIAAAVTRATPIVLLHGFMDSGATWDDVAEPLAAAGYEVWAPDQRGFGGSDRVTGGGYYHFPNYVADLHRLLDQLTDAPVILVGHSMGGTVAAMAAGARPERFSHVVLMEGIGPPDMGPGLAVMRTRAWLDGLDRMRGKSAAPLADLEDAARRLGATHPNISAEIIRRRAAQLVCERDGELHWCFDPLHRTTSPIPFIAAMLGAFLAEISCPLLFVSGGRDGFHPDDEAERLKLVRNLSRVELAEAGHMLHWTQPQQVAAAILAHVGHAP